MKPPRFPLDEYCECPSGRHVRRFLPQPETPDEEVLIARYDEAFVWPDRVDLAEAVERFLAAGPTPENLAWADGAEERYFDRIR